MPPSGMLEESKSRMLGVLLVGLAAVLLLGGGVYLAGRLLPSSSDPTKPLPMGPAEQAYAQQIHFSAPQVSRAANFLNQEVTFVFGTISDDGPRGIRQIEVTLEFHDVFNQVVLRDTQRLFAAAGPPLGPHQTRDFQLSYDTMPATWNQAYPTIRITGLDLQ
jgi:hypothetical protein